MRKNPPANAASTSPSVADNGADDAGGVEQQTADISSSDQASPALRSQYSREEAIRQAAYAAYERRGSTGGNEVQDWLDAEAEVDAQGGDNAS